VSQFEFVSVGVALVYSFAVARLLAALPSVVAPDKRHWTHLVWVAVVMLVLAANWWQIWLFRAIDWNPLRFIWILSVPALIYLRVGVLVSQAPADVRSWREHYYQARVPFFAIGLAIAVNGIVLPWGLGLVRWFVPTASHVMYLFLVLLYMIGLATDRPRIHAALGIANLLAVLVVLVLITWLSDGAA
jgi:hypothetical protein